MSYSSTRARMVDGHLVRGDGNFGSRFSSRRFLLVFVLMSVMAVTNPANELYDRAVDMFDELRGRKQSRRKEDVSNWAWRKMFDPAISVTNYGLFSVEEKQTEVVVNGLTQSWGCPYFDENMGKFCSTLARNVCHGKPLLHDPKDHAYTAHRCICFLLITFAVLSFCYGGQVPPMAETEPILRALFHSFGRTHFSLVSLGLDLFNAGQFVYPALVKMEQIVPTLQDGGVASSLGLPRYADFAFYAIALVLFLGGGSNVIAGYVSRAPILSFDSTVAAAAGYSNAFPSSFGATAGQIVPPHTLLWAYLPLTALLGGSLVSWIVAGMLGTMLGQYHLDNQDLLLAIKQTIRSFF